jgi:hypothetical protein
VGGKLLTFGVSGKLYANGLVMYDHQTDSLWSHVRGDAMTGQLAGTRLDIVPAMHTTWGVWRRLHPHTLVLDPSRSPYRRDYSVDPYEDYYANEQIGVLGSPSTDPRVSPKQFVVGVRRGDAVKAYPFAALSATPVVNDDLAGPIAVVFDTGAASATVFERRLGERELTFEPLRTEALRLRDRETGSIWDGRTGQALAGPLAGRRLVPVPATHAFWFGWRDHHSNTDVYESRAPSEASAPR